MKTKYSANQIYGHRIQWIPIIELKIKLLIEFNGTIFLTFLPKLPLARKKYLCPYGLGGGFYFQTAK